MLRDSQKQLASIFIRPTSPSPCGRLRLGLLRPPARRCLKCSFRDSVDAINPASPSIYYTSTSPRDRGIFWYMKSCRISIIKSSQRVQQKPESWEHDRSPTLKQRQQESILNMKHPEAMFRMLWSLLQLHAWRSRVFTTGLQLHFKATCSPTNST